MYGRAPRGPKIERGMEQRPTDREREKRFKNSTSKYSSTKIILKKEDLDDDNWLYLGKEDIEKIKLQISMLKSVRDFVPIIRD